MGCGGCELFPKSTDNVMQAVDEAVNEVNTKWKTGAAAKIMTELIHQQVESIKDLPDFDPENHLDKLTNTNVWHMRGNGQSYTTPRNFRVDGVGRTLTLVFP